MPLAERDQRITDILTVAKQNLDTVTGPDLIPIPELSSTISVLSSFIDRILVTKGNRRTREDIAKLVLELTLAIVETANKAKSAAGTDKIRTRLVNAPELIFRVATLQRDLGGLMNDLTPPKMGRLELLLRNKNAGMLSGIRSGIREATARFRGEIPVEMLINEIITDIALNEKALRGLPYVNAGYTSASKPTNSGTLPGTRTALLQEITEWALRSRTNADDSFIYVLSGGAGTGKSTIAFEIAYRLDGAGALGASFFFVRDVSKLNTTTLVLATIAYQLANDHTSLYPHIAKAALEYSRKGKQGVNLQLDLENLIIKPLMNVEASHRPITLVFDALDECTKAPQEGVIRLLSLFTERLPEIPFPVRILVTTRPEMEIEAAFSTEEFRNVSKQYRLHQVLRQIIDGDIKLFLETRLRNLSCWGSIFSTFPNVVEVLTYNAAGQFLYASTVVKFLDQNQYHAVDILGSILTDSPSHAAFTLINFDRLYISVLSHDLGYDSLDIPHMMKYVQIVLGSLALLQVNVSISDLNDLVEVPMRFIRDILARLGSVIPRPENDDVEIRIPHGSFPQFLIDAKRCTDPKFYVDPSVHHHRLASTCLEVMAVRHPLKRNICNLNDPTIMKSDIPDLHDAVKKCIKSSLRYSCIHWATHLSFCNDPDQDILYAVSHFARTQLLVWVEVLSYLNELEVAVPALLAVLFWCEVHIQGGDRNEIIQLVNDIHRLVLQCYAPINDCPEHLYISALPLAPSCALTVHHNNFVSIPTRNKDSIKSLMPRDSAWGPCLYTIPIEAGHCCAVLSPNGRWIASGSLNGEVCIWNASIGTSNGTFKGHTKTVCCVSWAPNGEFLASGSADGTIRIWNATSGRQLHTQEAQNTKGKLYDIAWSRDGTQLVTCANPGGIHVLTIVIGEKLNVKRTAPEIETVLAISEDLGHALDVDRRENAATLRVWDIERENGKILWELPVQFGVDAAVFLHNDTQVAFCGRDNRIHVWDFESNQCIPKVELEPEVTEEGKTFIHGISLSHNGNTLALSTIDRIHFLDTKFWHSLGSFQGSFRKASFSPNDHRLLTSFSTINMFDLSSVRAQKPQIIPSPPSSSSPIVKHDSPIHFVAMSLDGSRVAAVSRDAVSIWSLQSASLLCIFRGYFLGNVAFSPDAKKIVVLEYGKTVIWDITTMDPTLVRSVYTAGGAEDRIAWSSNGLWIASPACDPSTNTTRGFGVFDAMTGELIKYLVRSNNKRIWEVEFSHDNTLLYFHCGEDKTIFKWKEGEEVDLVQHKWKTERQRRIDFHKDAWIIRERDGKRLCWVQERYPESIAWWGNYYAVGRTSGKLDILYIEESSVETTRDS